MVDYFAGGNTGEGFVNYLPEVLDDIKRVWILRGTPGSGKSSFMKRIAAKAEKHGIAAERVHCSFDSGSLDGVVLREASFAVIDGTPPHSMDAIYPLAVQSEYNLAQFMDKSVIDVCTDRVKALVDGKKLLMRQATAVLKADCALRSLLRRTVERDVLWDKMRSYINRVVSKLDRTPGKTIFRQASAFGRWGVEELPCDVPCERRFVFDDGDSDLRTAFFDILCEETRMFERVVSRDPTDSAAVSSVTFPRDGLIFIAGKCGEGDGKRINFERFVSRDGLRSTSSLRRYINRTRRSLRETAASFFAEAYEKHFQLEGIYVRAADFAKLEDFETKLLQTLF